MANKLAGVQNFGKGVLHDLQLSLMIPDVPNTQCIADPVIPLLLTFSLAQKILTEAFSGLFWPPLLSMGIKLSFNEREISRKTLLCHRQMKRIGERSTEKEQTKLIATSTDKMPNLCTKPSLVG
jgi:hypothetical protein